MVPRPTASVSNGNFLEMHILGTFPDYWIRTLGFSNLCFNNPSRWLYMLNFDNNHNLKYYHDQDELTNIKGAYG